MQAIRQQGCMQMTAAATIRLLSNSVGCDLLYTHALQAVTTAEMKLLLPTLSLQQLLGCESCHAHSHPAPICTVLLQHAL